jgi:hypothetical protein
VAWHKILLYILCGASRDACYYTHFRFSFYVSTTPRRRFCQLPLFSPLHPCLVVPSNSLLSPRSLRPPCPRPAFPPRPLPSRLPSIDCPPPNPPPVPRRRRLGGWWPGRFPFAIHCHITPTRITSKTGQRRNETRNIVNNQQHLQSAASPN